MAAPKNPGLVMNTMDAGMDSEESAAAGDTNAATRVRMREFSRSLPMLLLRGREAVMRHFRPSLREHGVTEQQWRVLRALSSVFEIEVTDLAGATCLLAPSLSRILRDLEHRGLVLRRSNPRDMRRGLVAIAPQGLELIEILSPRSEEIYARICSQVGKEKFHHLQELLRYLEVQLMTDDLAHAEIVVDATRRGDETATPSSPRRHR